MDKQDTPSADGLTPAPAVQAKPIDERQQFEDWARGQGFNVERGATGLYKSLGTNQLLSGWMGRASQAVPPVGCAEAQKQDKPEPGAQAKVQPEPREPIASRQVGRIERELEDFCLWLIESGLQWVANELASRVVILPSGSVAEASKRDEPNPVPAPATPAAQGVPDTLTKDEIAAILHALSDHDGSDFEAECPECTAYKKLAARTLTSASDAAHPSTTSGE